MVKYPDLKEMKRLSVIVLAGGKGTRMNSNVPKVVLPLAGKPIIYWVVKLLVELGIKEIIVICGNNKKILKSSIGASLLKNVTFVYQKNPMGTAHAVSLGIKKVDRLTDTVMVLFGDDAGLYRAKSMLGFIKYHILNNSKMTVMVTEMPHPSDIGGLEIDENNNVKQILTLSRLISLGIKKPKVLCGAFCFNRKWLIEYLPIIPKSELSGEYPLPGLFSVMNGKSVKAKCYYLNDQNEWNSINTPKELRQANLKKKIQLHGN